MNKIALLLICTSVITVVLLILGNYRYSYVSPELPESLKSEVKIDYNLLNPMDAGDLKR